MFLGAITGVPSPACLSATSNPVEAVTPPNLGSIARIWSGFAVLDGPAKELI